MAIRIPSIDWTQPGMVVSGVAHVALLAATLIAFADARPLEDATESIPVEVITDSQFSQMTRGETTAREVKPNPLPRAEKKAEIQETKPEAVELKRDVPVPPTRPPEPPAEQKIAALPLPPERPKEDEAKAEAEKARAEAEAKARADAAAKAEAQARAEARAKADADARAKAEARAEAEALEKARAEQAKAKAEAYAKVKAEAEAKAKVEAEARARAEARAKAEAEAEAKRREAEARVRAAEQQRLATLAAAQAKPEPPRPPVPRAEPKPEAKFDPSAIEKLLTSKEKAQQAPSTAREINRTASLGTAAGSAAKLNPSQKDALGSLLKEQIRGCWNPPPGFANIDNLKPRFTMSLKQDGSLQADPVLANPSGDPAFRAMAESANRAIRRCAPFRIPAQYAPFYSDWQDWTITFDAKEMLS
ncbi:MAG: cell envelope integrity protein TolA [Burkholderiales bacterium]|nr:cell envelope integrity protein TolA [Burkholderiales bacterium]